MKDENIAAKFWKSLCALLSSRLFVTQSVLQTHLPPVPNEVEFEVPDKERTKAERIGSFPSLPPLPKEESPPIVPKIENDAAKQELLDRIRKRGFFVGVDVPAEQGHDGSA